MLEGYQRDIVQRMSIEIENFEDGSMPLGDLVSHLRGIYAAASIRDDDIETSFENAWVKLDHQNELRTEPWFPEGEAKQEDLDGALLQMKDWIYENGPEAK
jgi:hypothetical protein